jgi:hypothetical protein
MPSSLERVIYMLPTGWLEAACIIFSEKLDLIHLFHSPVATDGKDQA